MVKPWEQVWLSLGNSCDKVLGMGVATFGKWVRLSLGSGRG